MVVSWSHILDVSSFVTPSATALETGREEEVEFLDEDLGRWVKSAIYPTELYVTGRGRLYCHFVQDIDARKREEIELKDSYQRVHEAMEGSINTIL